jgi:ZIP family zinc transporter
MNDEPQHPQGTIATARSRATPSVREWIGLAIVTAGALALVSQFWQFVRADPVVWNAWVGGSVAALATALGTLPVVFSQKLPERLQDTLFGFGAGVMLAACAFSLIIPGSMRQRTSASSAAATGLRAA